MKQELKLKVTRVHRLDGASKVKAFVDVLVNEALLLKGIRIVDGRNGLFVSMPRMRGKDNRWYETIHPATNSERDLLSGVVLTAYQERFAVT